MLLTEVFARALDAQPEEFTDESSRETVMGWTSLRHVKLLVEVETAYGIRFSNAEMAAMHTLGDVRAALTRRGAEVL